MSRPEHRMPLPVVRVLRARDSPSDTNLGQFLHMAPGLAPYEGSGQAFGHIPKIVAIYHSASATGSPLKAVLHEKDTRLGQTTPPRLGSVHSTGISGPFHPKTRSEVP